MSIVGRLDLEIIDDPAIIEREQSPAGKPFIRLTFPDGYQADITTNIAEMIGGAGAGTRKRYGY